MKTTSLIFHI